MIKRCGLVMSIILAMIAMLAPVRADSLPGDAFAAPFWFSFDENGNGSWALRDTITGNPVGAWTSSPGVMEGGFLTYTLPQMVPPGDIGFYETSNPQSLSDGLRFVQLFDDQNQPLPTTTKMIYWSDPGDPDLADTGPPSGFLPSLTLPEIGEEGFNHVFYDTSHADPVGYVIDNAYFGLSDVPEPGRIVGLLGLAGMGLIGLVWRRRRTA